MDDGTPSIWVTCPACGDQRLRPSALHITVYSHGRNVYRFFCHQCADEVVKPVPQETCELLLEAGVEYNEVHVPAEVLEHPPAHVPPISPDDVLEFILELRQMRPASSLDAAGS